MNSQFYTGYKGPISQASGAVNADYVLVNMCASVATGEATPEAAAAEAERRAKRYYRRAAERELATVMPGRLSPARGARATRVTECCQAGWPGSSPAMTFDHWMTRWH